MYKSPHDPAGPPEQSQAVCPSASGRCFLARPLALQEQNRGVSPGRTQAESGHAVDTYGANVIYQARLRGWQVLVELPFFPSKKGRRITFLVSKRPCSVVDFTTFAASNQVPFRQKLSDLFPPVIRKF